MSAATFGGALLLALAPLAAAGPGGLPGKCATCHPTAEVQWSASSHAAEGIACGSCHGGDPTVLDAATGHAGMRRFESPREIADVCGGCHAEVSSMRPYGLAVDQLALYESSAHGRARLGGAERAPVCVDCHDNHVVLALDNPASATAPGNVAATCGACHADTEATREHGLSSRVVAGFLGSRHARAVGEREGRAGPTCAVCHDAHGAAVPRPTHVDEVCGGCHRETRTRLRAGSHRALLERADLNGCASCHPVHDGLAAAAVDSICADCHGPRSSQATLGKELGQMLRETREEVARAELAIFRGQRVPLPARDHEALVADARRLLQEARPTLHTFRHGPVESLARRARSHAAQVQREIEDRLERRQAKTWLVVFWFYAAVTLAVLARLRRRALRRGAP